MAHWSDPLLRLLAEQPAETTSVTLTYAELAALAGGPLPPSGVIRGYWWNRRSGQMGHRVAVIGWRVGRVRGRPPTITFVRQPPAGSA